MCWTLPIFTFFQSFFPFGLSCRNSWQLSPLWAICQRCASSPAKEFCLLIGCFFLTPSKILQSCAVRRSVLHGERRYRPGGVLPSKRLLGMCRWMGSHFHIWTDYNGVTFLACFSRVTRMGSQIFGIFGISRKILVSMDLKIGIFAAEKWFLLLF